MSHEYVMDIYYSTALMKIMEINKFIFMYKLHSLTMNDEIIVGGVICRRVSVERD